MASLPQRNARLTAVGRAGTVEDWDTPEDPDGDAVWTGEVDAYYGERRATVAEAQALSRTSVAYLIVPGDLDVAGGLKAGDKVTFVDAMGDTSVRTVREARAPRMEGVPSWPVRLDLDPT